MPDPRGNSGRRDVFVKTFLKGDKNQLLILPNTGGGPVQITAQCSNRTKGPVRLEGPIQSWGQGWYNHWGHIVWSLFGQLLLGKRAG